ncbi:alanine racemase [Pseudogracilibacillus sp. SE30717A]|uniref:alanine racemase n=1 Tax=Pseudogracilibacillus sp. SE30717A TaxID=3098293 RepID=UPI00300E4859
MVHFKNEEILNDTPVVVLDFDILEQNIEWLNNLAEKSNIKLRPHVKTHKSTYIADLQIKAGATGITTATLGEAEVMVNSGIRDILIAYPIIGEKKLKRFGKLLKHADLTVALDDIIVAKGLSEVGKANSKTIDIYIDIDTGNERMGRSPQESINEILEIAALPFINIKGLTSHPGHAYAESDVEKLKRIAIDDATELYKTKMLLEKENLHIPEISVGATAIARFTGEIPYVTEVRAGMYVFNDRNVMATGGATEDDCAVTIYSTVVSRPSKDRLIIDAGSKTLAHDPNIEGGFGRIKNQENLVIKRLSEEHAIVEIQGKCDLRVGDIVEIIPNHICPVINLTDEVYGFRGGVFEKTVTIDARGKNK